MVAGQHARHMQALPTSMHGKPRSGVAALTAITAGTDTVAAAAVPWMAVINAVIHMVLLWLPLVVELHEFGNSFALYPFIQFFASV
jgi:hypothetical protein